MDPLISLRILLARWKIAAIGALGCGALALLYVLIMPPAYKATAEVLVNVRTPDTVGDNPGQPPVDQLNSDYMSTQADVLGSDRVALAAVDLLGLAKDPQALADYRKSNSPSTPENYFANLLKRGLKVTPSPGSRVINIVYRASNPQGAADVANAFASAYRQTVLDLQVDPARQSAVWYDQRAKELQDQLTKAQAELDIKRQQLGVASDQDQTDAEVARWNALSGQLAVAQASQSATNSRSGGSALPDAMASPVVQKIQSDIATAEAQKQALSATAGPNNPDYIQVTRTLDELHKQLSSQEALIARSVATSGEQSNQNVARLTAAAAAEKARVIANRASRDAVTVLQQEVDSLQLVYNQVVAKRSQVSLLGADVQTNVSTLATAVPPVRPAGLPAPFLIAFGLFAGGVMGAALAIVLEFLDQRIRAASDAEVFVGIPNLGEIKLGRPSGGNLLSSSLHRFLPHATGNAQ